MKSILTFWALLGFLIFTVACSNDDDVVPTADSDLQKVAEATESGLNVEVYAEEPLVVAYKERFFGIHLNDKSTFRCFRHLLQIRVVCWNNIIIVRTSYSKYEQP